MNVNSSSGCRGARCCRAAMLPAHAAMQGAGDDARMGRAHARTGRRQGRCLRRHQRLPGRASRRSQAEPGRARAQRRSGRRRGRRTRGRLAADPAARVRQCAHPARQSRATSRRRRTLHLLEMPSAVDRSMGDVHPLGNPHAHLDPHNVALVATALTARLMAVDPANAKLYEARGADFQARWKAAIARWEQQAAPLKDAPVVVIHRDQAVPVSLAGTARSSRPSSPSPACRRAAVTWPSW